MALRPDFIVAGQIAGFPCFALRDTEPPWRKAGADGDGGEEQPDASKGSRQARMPPGPTPEIRVA